MALSPCVSFAALPIGTELTGPATVEGEGSFPRDGLYNVAASYNIKWTYADGVEMHGVHEEPGRDLVCITFFGTEGWLYVGSQLDGEPKSILTSVIGPNEDLLPQVNDHHGNFLDCIRTREEPLAPVEQAHRSAAICHIGQIAMQVGRKLQWDPVAESFVNDPEANRLLSRPMRSPWRQ
jgi:hypothetical protein